MWTGVTGHRRRRRRHTTSDAGPADGERRSDGRFFTGTLHRWTVDHFGQSTRSSLSSTQASSEGPIDGEGAVSGTDATDDEDYSDDDSTDGPDEDADGNEGHKAKPADENAADDQIAVDYHHSLTDRIHLRKPPEVAAAGRLHHRDSKRHFPEAEGSAGTPVAFSPEALQKYGLLNEVRLPVTLLPTRLFHIPSRTSVVVADSLEVQNAAPLKYLAISYMWRPHSAESDDDPNPASRVHGVGWPIRSVSAETLDKIIADAASLGFEYMWMDVLCINQNGHEARLHELKRMGEYYTNASVCLAFLENPADDHQFDPKGRFKRSPPWFRRVWTAQEGWLPTQVVYLVDRATTPSTETDSGSSCSTDRAETSSAGTATGGRRFMTDYHLFFYVKRSCMFLGASDDLVAALNFLRGSWVPTALYIKELVSHRNCEYIEDKVKGTLGLHAMMCPEIFQGEAIPPSGRSLREMDEWLGKALIHEALTWWLLTAPLDREQRPTAKPASWHLLKTDAMPPSARGCIIYNARATRNLKDNTVAFRAVPRLLNHNPVAATPSLDHPHRHAHGKTHAHPQPPAAALPPLILVIKALRGAWTLQDDVDPAAAAASTDPGPSTSSAASPRRRHTHIAPAPPPKPPSPPPPPPPPPPPQSNPDASPVPDPPAATTADPPTPDPPPHRPTFFSLAIVRHYTIIPPNADANAPDSSFPAAKWLRPHRASTVSAAAAAGDGPLRVVVSGPAEWIDAADLDVEWVRDVVLY